MDKKTRLLEQIKADGLVKLTGRELLDIWGFQRRTSNNCYNVDHFLEQHKLEVSPHYNDVWVDNELTIKGKEKATRREAKDPIKRIEALQSANISPITINNDADLSKAITIMMSNNFSQLPVTTGGSALHGYISWETIGKALANGVRSSLVRDFTEKNIKTLSPDTALLKAIGVVYKHDFVVIQAKDKALKGIVTTADISKQFLAFTEPFLLIEEIENHIRQLLDGKIHLEDIQDLCKKDGKPITHLDDLSFGDYVSVIGNPDCWEKLQFSSLDRETLVKLLDDTRSIRNDIMHFEPAGISPENSDKLSNVRELLCAIAKYPCNVRNDD